MSFGEMLISSRSFEEYRAMFALDDEDLAARILDCPSGASGFTAELRERGGEVTACDAAYLDHGLDAVAAAAAAETDRGNRYVRAHPQQYRWSFFADPDAHQRIRHHAAERFAVHCCEEPHRYVPGLLPKLPFDDDSFDLALSSHLLFTYAEELGYDFHLRAIAELIRVTSREVRIFPLVPIGSAATYPRLGE
ncbi:hypothetical protein ACW9HQ_44190, partial [Nocardia gipuzkoensis]